MRKKKHDDFWERPYKYMKEHPIRYWFRHHWHMYTFQFYGLMSVLVFYFVALIFMILGFLNLVWSL